MSQPLTAEKLRRRLDPASLGFEDTSQLEPLDEVIGQDRAVRAVSFGIGIHSPGFNMYALGPGGTGKMTTIRKFLEREARTRPVPDDWCYVHNFQEEHRPRVLRLPAGRGRQLRDDMVQLVKQLETEIRQAFAGEGYARQREDLLREIQKRRSEALEEMESLASQAGFALVRTPVGMVVTPTVDGQPLSQDQYQGLPEEQRRRLEEEQAQLQEELSVLLRRVQRMEREARQKVEKLDQEVARYTAGQLMQELREKYARFPEVLDYLEKVLEDVVQRADEFKGTHEEREMPQGQLLLRRRQPPVQRYQVNLLVDNSEQQGAPVIVEPNPHYLNLMGRIDHVAQFGALTTDFSMIKPGALHRANGGYLLVEVRDLLANPFSYEALKRALKTRCIRVEELASQLRVISTQTLEPEPVPLEVKIVLLGNALIYYLLNGLDEEFRELFKVKAEFTRETDWEPEQVRQYARFVGTIVGEEELLPFRAEAVAEVIEHAARQVADQQKLGTRFGELVDLIREASYWAGQERQPQVRREDVRRALEERIYRSNLMEERLREEIVRGTLLIQTDGQAVGQVNGLSVAQLGNYTFGRPTRVTARTYMGRQGVVNIERETELSGRLHSKGVLILGGYLSELYAQRRPLTLGASLTFEQLYDEVDGDSASSTELYALLSSLSGHPLRQDVAVTGALSQRGEIQPIGGVNEKVEGFFAVCRERGLTGRQGVMIPEGNVPHLMLRPEVVEAVDRGEFHVWAVSHVDQGIELLTGVPAGEPDPEGRYPEDSLHGAVQRRLEEMAEGYRRYAFPSDGAPGVPVGVAGQEEGSRGTPGRGAGEAWPKPDEGP